MQNAKCKMQSAKCKVQHQRPIYLDRKNEREQGNHPAKTKENLPASHTPTLHFKFCILHFALAPQYEIIVSGQIPVPANK
jgi:hypothetical protein